MQKKYGKKEGTKIYYASENKGSSAFKKGVKTASQEGHTAPTLADAQKRLKERAKDGK